MKKKKMSIQEMDNMLNKASGLKGISGISNDMRVLEAKERQGNKRAKLARDIFAYRIRKYIGAYVAIMSGCDALVFTAGIGENQKSIRDRITKDLFSHFIKAPRIMFIPTDEELMIARQTCKLITRRAYRNCAGVPLRARRR
jgi:acetate kinase